MRNTNRANYVLHCRTMREHVIHCLTSQTDLTETLNFHKHIFSQVIYSVLYKESIFNGYAADNNETMPFFFIFALLKIGVNLLPNYVNTLYNGIRYNSKIHYNVNPICTNISGSCIFSSTVPCYSLGKHTFWIFIRIASPSRF